MLFISAEDFLAKAGVVQRLSRDEERTLAQRMAGGDQTAREELVRGQFPLVASLIRRAPREIRDLRTVYACIAVVEKGVDRFDFFQDAEPFARYLGRGLRQCITRCIAERF